MAIPLIPVLGAVASTAISAFSKTASKPASQLGKDDFLKLLVAQLKNQDPLNPLSNDQFINQSAAFSSLEQLQNISKGIDSLNSGGGSGALSGAAALLGRPVVAATGNFAYTGAPVSLPYALGAPVGNAALEVLDASGTVVARQALGAQGPGQHTAVFAPPTNRVLPSGQLKYRIVSMDGGQSTVLPAVAGSVTGITLAGGQPVLQVGAVTINLGDVTSIGTPTN